MNDTHTAVISAFLDNEPVDPDSLGAALADADARAALVDFVRLRQELGSDPAALPASLRQLRRRSGLRVQVIRWSAAAALLALVFLAGWMVPRPGAGPVEDSASTPPQPVRVEKFVPGVDWSFK